MSKAHILGFPRIGAQRELKWALESFWKGELKASGLLRVGEDIRLQNWQWQSNAGLDFVTVGDFSLYDHVLDTSLMLGVVPQRFDRAQTDSLETYFKMARGGDGDQTACQMTKWFDTNYHYIVPEFEPGQRFQVDASKLLQEIEQAQQAGFNAKPVLLGPLSYLYLGKLNGAAEYADQEKLDLLDGLLAAYKAILLGIESLGVTWVQIDEPILALDLSPLWRHAFESAYSRLQTTRLKLLLCSYFSYLGENLNTAINLPVAGLHVDAVEGASDLPALVDQLASYKSLSVGIVNGRNIWKNDFKQSLAILEPIKKKLQDRLWVSSSCSLLHCPVDLASEVKIEPEIKSWLAFARQKLDECVCLKGCLNEGADKHQAVLDQNRSVHRQRSDSGLLCNEEVAQSVETISEQSYSRSKPYSLRQLEQRKRLNLPILPTTTIGSFPQTKAIRRARADYKRGDLSGMEYEAFIKQEIKSVIQTQQDLELDVLVHGEPERNDMVEYFGELLQGCLIAQNAWVQSYGSRCVKPPIIYGDVYRDQPMTVKWAAFAQAQSDKPVKAMLTGPLTILKWSFVREDQSREITCKQIALAIREEVEELERAGIGIIQIDEPALREALPLHREEQPAYLEWAVNSFRLASSGVADSTQIHSHMCYSNFNDFIEPIIKMDADVITIETSRSDMALLNAFERFDQLNEIGPGVYDIHSPRVPGSGEIKSLIAKALHKLPPDRLWVNPDCGLKTRDWPEVKAALSNMVSAAKALRKTVAKEVA